MKRKDGQRAAARENLRVGAERHVGRRDVGIERCLVSCICEYGMGRFVRLCVV